MPWVRIDDEFSEHPKVAALSDSAVALFVTGLAYCNRNLTDGFIPSAVGLGQLRYCDGNTVPHIRQLEAAGMWEPVQGGWKVHDFEHYQPTRAQVEADRAQKVEAGRIGGRVRAALASRSSGKFTSRPLGDSTRQTSGTFTRQKPAPVPVPVPVPVRDTSPPTPSHEAGEMDGGNGTRGHEPTEAEQRAKWRELRQTNLSVPSQNAAFNDWLHAVRTGAAT